MRLVPALLTTALLAPPTAAGGAPPDRLVLAARSAAATAAALRAIPVEEDEATDVPPAARSGLRALKGHLGDYVAAALACSAAESDSPERITAALSDGLRAEGLDAGQPSPEGGPPDSAYGDLVDLVAERPPGAPGLLAVTARLGVPYGSDGVLWLFERRGDRWLRTLTASSDGYASISEAKGGFRAVVEVDGSGRPVVLTGDVSPWPTSNWQRLRVEVLRPGAAPDRPRRLLSVERSIFLGGSDDPFSLALSGDSFRVEYDAEQSLDDGRLVRSHLIAGRVTADGVELASPVAEDPLGFVDEWVSTPWEESRAWGEEADAEPPDAWREWHGRLAAGDLFTELRAPEPCPSDPACWTVRLDLYEEDYPEPSSWLRFTVARRDGEPALHLRDLEASAGAPPRREALETTEDGGEP